MRKILIVSTVSRQFYLFEQGNIEVLKSLGYEVHGAANFSDASERLDELDIVQHHFNIQRSPFSLLNIKAYKQLKKIMKEGNFDAVHCHSPMGGVLGRLAAKATGISTVIYTAHGFHFFKGAPIINWLIYYPVEKFLSRYTSLLITMNKEDYEIAKSLNCSRVEYIPGIGVDVKKFNNSSLDTLKKRKELDIDKDDVVLLSIGELIKRKNHITALKAISKINEDNFIYLICGKGELERPLKKIVEKLNIKEKVKFLGYRNDISEILQISDIFIFPSYQEGLPVSMIEAMSSGLPIICSKIRGNVDLIENNKGGNILEVNDIEGFSESMSILINNIELRKKMGSFNMNTIQYYDILYVKKIMEKIYNEIDIIG